MGPITLNAGTRQVHVAEKLVALTGAEFRVLELLMRSAGQVISRESMTEQALGRKLAAYDRSIDTHISNLRRKLDLESGKNPEIKNVRGSGYTLRSAGACIACFSEYFCCFWLAMTLIVGSSIATTFTIAARENEPLGTQRRPSAAIQASEILARGGLPALKSWLKRNKNSMADRELFIIGPDGEDILGRRLPEGARGAWNSSIARDSREISVPSAPLRKSSPPTARPTPWYRCRAGPASSERSACRPSP